jgi:hypothetical protein
VKILSELRPVEPVEKEVVLRLSIKDARHYLRATDNSALPETKTMRAAIFAAFENEVV